MDSWGSWTSGKNKIRTERPTPSSRPAETHDFTSMTPAVTATPPPPPPRPSRRVDFRDPRLRSYEQDVSSDDSVRVSVNNSGIPEAKEELDNPHDTLAKTKKEEPPGSPS